jgi:hypothetical protein
MPRTQAPMAMTRGRFQAGTHWRAMLPRTWVEIVVEGRWQKENRRRSPQRPKSRGPDDTSR